MGQEWWPAYSFNYSASHSQVFFKSLFSNYSVVCFSFVKFLFKKIINRNNSARELSVFAESAMAVKRVVMQHFSMNLTLEARLRSLDEDSGLGQETEVIEMDVDSQSVEDDTIQFGHLSLDSENVVVPVKSSMSSASMDHSARGESRKKVTFGLAPPTGSRLAQRRLKSCLSLDALTPNGN